MTQYDQNPSSENPHTMRDSDSHFLNKRPVLFTLVGLPGSGKSTHASQLVERLKANGCNAEIVSSDAVRKELFGTEEDQTHNAEVFAVVHSRIRQYLTDGISVIFDATNLSKKRRKALIQDLKSIPCRHVCHAVMTPFDICLERNRARSRSVPEHALRRMYLTWEPPHYSEGFDYVNFITSCSGITDPDQYVLTHLLGQANFLYLDQENSHHSHTLGVHCLMAMMNALYRDRFNTRLQIAALLHDIGKMKTKSPWNAKGVSDGNCHYYQHHCVGAYDSLFYLNNLAFTNEDKAHIANMIFYHMHPHLSWRQSEKARERDRAFLRDELFDDIVALHEADEAAQ